MTRVNFGKIEIVWALLMAFALSCVPLSGLHASNDAILLEVEGEAGVVGLDREALDAMRQVSFETTTIWTKGKQRFSGPPLSDVLSEAGLGGRSVVAEAANDYNMVISSDLIGDEFPIIATRIDGEPFGVRKKGPLWIVFPYDRSSDFQRELIFASSIWQLVRLRPAGD